ncbi:MAG TPA: DNA polymerase IV, partial [Thermoanaerobaculia bacterium]
FGEQELVLRFGRWGTRLWELSHGIDESPVVPSRKRKSWSRENTFATDISSAEVVAWLRDNADALWRSLEERSLRGRTVTVKLRTPDFTTLTRRVTPAEIPSSGSDLAKIAVGLLERFDFPDGSKFRLAGIGVSNFVEDEEETAAEGEPLLFDAPR